MILILFIFINSSCSEILVETTIAESDLESPTLKFGELPILDDQDLFSKTGSVTFDAQNYAKQLVNLCRSHVQTCMKSLHINN